MARGVKMTQIDFEKRVFEVWGGDYSCEKAVYINAQTPVCLVCKKHGDFYETPHQLLNLHIGCKKCRHDRQKRLVCGVGHNDLDDTSFDKNGKRLKSYYAWCSMLSRCYSRKYSYSTYVDCYVCDEWLLYSNFKCWFDDPQNGYRDGFELDKDILVKNNKIYSPETCCFVPKEINTLMAFRKKSIKNNGLTGVHKKGNKYGAVITVGGNQVYLGTFTTSEEAAASYKKEKEKIIKQMACKYYKKGFIQEKVYKALINYNL